MPVLRADDLARWSRGAWTPSKPPFLRGVSADTRTLQENNLYIALKGARFDGHDFVADAFARGAAGALVNGSFAEGHSLPGPALCVDDPLKALGALAAGYRATLETRLIAVTGSVGKTTVKEMIADILASIGPTARTRGNWNNDIGLPLSLLAMEPEDRFGVFELGMNHPGELAPLCRILRPSWGVVTNVGPVHTEFFDSVEAIAREKAAVLQALPKDGAAVLNRDDAWYELLRAAAPCRVVTTSISGEADYEGRLAVKPGRFTTFERATGERAQIELPLPGDHVVRNALMAIAVARGHGASWESIRKALASYAPPPMRWNRSTVAGVDVINDAYNANPMSMRAALSAFLQTPVAGGRWLVMGGMLELGSLEEEEHLALGRAIGTGPWAGLIAVGALGARVADGAESAGMPAAKIARCENAAAAARALKERCSRGDAVLLKASRKEALERVVEEWSKGI